MPELPEVETVVRSLRPRLCGRRIVAFASSWPRQVQPSPAALRRAALGRTIERVERRGKYIVLALDDASALLWHLKMSGRFEWDADCAAERAHVRARLELSDGQRLLFCDARKFGRISHVSDPAAALAHLGPEPLERGFSARRLGRLLAGRRRALKALLLDQGFVAGLGNIYSDEALHRARLHPLRRADGLAAAEVRRLHRAVRAVLRQGIALCGTSLDWVYPGGRMQTRLRVYGRGGRACARCGAAIARIRVAQRSTHFCPGCQRPAGP